MAGEMIERVAKAMWERNRERCGEVGVEIDPWEAETEGLRGDWRAFASAALDAMREPTAEMISEAISDYVGDVDALRTWQSMIDAASE